MKITAVGSSNKENPKHGSEASQIAIATLHAIRVTNMSAIHFSQ